MNTVVNRDEIIKLDMKFTRIKYELLHEICTINLHLRQKNPRPDNNI